VPVDCPLSSIDDPRLAPYRHLAAPEALKTAGLFVAEGRLVVRRLIDASPFEPHSFLLTPAARRNLDDVLRRAPEAVPAYLVDQAVMNGVVGFNIHRGCLALVHRPATRAIESLDLSSCRRLLVVEGVSNPDNIGGLFRNAAAFGVDAVVLGPGCGDPLYRKAIRTSMGAALTVPFCLAGDWPGALVRIGDAGLHLLALTPDPAAPALDEVDRRLHRLALVVGAEGHGVSPAALEAIGRRVRIPMASGVDSINVATAAAIALHHFFPEPR
jgi:tRNA G18 (ribose-2'-O)-methylase SpoU